MDLKKLAANSSIYLEVRAQRFFESIYFFVYGVKKNAEIRIKPSLEGGSLDVYWQRFFECQQSARIFPTYDRVVNQRKS